MFAVMEVVREVEFEWMKAVDWRLFCEGKIVHFGAKCLDVMRLTVVMRSCWTNTIRLRGCENGA